MPTRAQLDEALTLTADDLRFATSAIQAALDGFQKNKVADFRAMFLGYARLHREFCRVVSGPHAQCGGDDYS